MAFNSISNLTLSKPTIYFNTRSWFVTYTLANPTLTFTLSWRVETELPNPSTDILLVSNYTANTTLPIITLSSSFVSNNLYTTNYFLKKPNLVYEIVAPNTGYLISTLLKPTIQFIGDSDIVGEVDYNLPLINISFNTILTATSTKQTWTFNTITTAHSRYTNYDFNSFFKLGSINYGINTNGSIYKLTGSKDFVGELTETNINTEITFPSTTFDEQTLKSCSDVIIYGRGNGNMEVQIILDEQQARTGYIVPFDNREGMHRNRVKIPKGLKGNLWQFKLKNVDGSWFDINMFEVFIRSMQRIKW